MRLHRQQHDRRVIAPEPGIDDPPRLWQVVIMPWARRGGRPAALYSNRGLEGAEARLGEPTRLFLGDLAEVVAR